MLSHKCKRHRHEAVEETMLKRRGYVVAREHRGLFIKASRNLFIALLYIYIYPLFIRRLQFYELLIYEPYFFSRLLSMFCRSSGLFAVQVIDR